MSKLRAGLIGFGAMGRNHARVLSSLEGVELIGIVDPVVSKTNSNVLENVEELIDLKPDYCVVATPTISHDEVALRLAEADINALIEKPLAASYEAASNITETFRKMGLIGAVGHIERFNASLVQTRRRIKEGQLGEIFQISTSRQGPFPSRVGDIGVVKDLATHDIDLSMWLVDSSYSQVSAQIAAKSGRLTEDFLIAVGRLECGIITSHIVNWLSPFKQRLTIITGEMGALVADTVNSELTFHRNGSIRTEWGDLARLKGVSEGDSTRYAFAKPEPLLTEHLEFVRALRGEESEIVSMREGAEIVRVAEAMIESSLNNENIQLGNFKK